MSSGFRETDGGTSYFDEKGNCLFSTDLPQSVSKGDVVIFGMNAGDQDAWAAESFLFHKSLDGKEWEVTEVRHCIKRRSVISQSIAKFVTLRELPKKG